MDNPLPWRGAAKEQLVDSQSDESDEASSEEGKPEAPPARRQRPSAFQRIRTKEKIVAGFGTKEKKGKGGGGSAVPLDTTGGVPLDTTGAQRYETWTRRGQTQSNRGESNLPRAIGTRE